MDFGTESIKQKVRDVTSIIIPCKNESDGIAHLIEEVKKYGNEVIIIDGHSTDGTYEIAKRMGVKVIQDDGHGKGSGIRCGIEHVRNDIIVFIDADGSHAPEDIPKLVLPILENKSDMVIGSRMYGGSDEYELTIDSFIRQVGSAFITLIINLRWKTNLSDIENGFGAIKTSVAKKLGLNAEWFDIEQEMVQKCLKKGYRIVEVPSHEYRRKWGKTKLLTKNGYIFLFRLLRDI